LTTAPIGLSRAANTLVVAFGLLHVGSLFLAADGPVTGFLVGLLAASALPYLLCLGVLQWTRSVGAALGGLLAIALFDAWMYWSVFIAPRGSTAAVGLVFAPLWKTFILLPIGAVIGRVIEARLARRAAR
jgi:hypothetical protein